MTTPLYLRRLRLADIRLFEDLEILFESPGQSILLIGDNGEGKSTVLRSLAMGICDQSSASALFRELHGEYVRIGSKKGKGTIDIELEGRAGESFRIVTEIKSLHTFERVEQTLYERRSGRTRKLSQDEFPWQRIFASGYGPGIRSQGTTDFDYYLTVDAVYPLFRYDVLLQNPELVIRRVIDAARKKGNRRADQVLSQIKGLLAHVLQLDKPDDVYLEEDGIQVRAAPGKIGLSALSDGYRGTVTWLMDLVSWWWLFRRDWASPTFLKVPGIVIVDEVEQHLHPRWQRDIMRLLRESFPRVQFVAATHSPLVASGSRNMPLIRLRRDGAMERLDTFGWLAEDVYEAMGIPSSRAEPFRREVLTVFSELDLKRLAGKATPQDLRRLREARRELDRLPGDDPWRLATEIRNIRRALTKELNKTKADSGEKS